MNQPSLQNPHNTLFPVFLKLENMQVLLVGGGKVALEKLNAILQNAPGTAITLVATEISEEVKALAKTSKRIILIERAFDINDLSGKDIVFIATNHKESSALIRQEAKKHRLLVNVADTPELCDFYLGSIVQKGSVKIAISTDGRSPTLAKRLKEILQEAIPDSVHRLAGQLHLIRTQLKGSFTQKVETLNALTETLVKKE